MVWGCGGVQGITGAFRPGVLTALMGASGAGKTTLMDVLADRKTGQSSVHPFHPFLYDPLVDSLRPLQDSRSLRPNGIISANSESNLCFLVFFSLL